MLMVCQQSMFFRIKRAHRVECALSKLSGPKLWTLAEPVYLWISAEIPWLTAPQVKVTSLDELLTISMRTKPLYRFYKGYVLLRSGLC